MSFPSYSAGLIVSVCSVTDSQTISLIKVLNYMQKQTNAQRQTTGETGNNCCLWYKARTHLDNECGDTNCVLLHFRSISETAPCPTQPPKPVVFFAPPQKMKIIYHIRTTSCFRDNNRTCYTAETSLLGPEGALYNELKPGSTTLDKWAPSTGALKSHRTSEPRELSIFNLLKYTLIWP